MTKDARSPEDKARDLLSAYPDEILAVDVRAALKADISATLTTQSALIETLTRERDEARQQYVDANEARIDAEAVVKQLMDAGTYLLGVQANSKLRITANNKFMAALESARALKSA